MKKKLYQFVLGLFLAGAALMPAASYAQAVVPGGVGGQCPLCTNVAWGPTQIHQYYFTPMALPSCLMFGELRYRTKMCNGMLMYEILDEEFTVVSGGCSFAMCIYAELHKDVEKEMILNVLGTTNVYSSKPSACYRLVTVDPNANPMFRDCWTHHGSITFQSDPIMRIACSNFCCVAQANVYYDAHGRPIIVWNPLGNVTCDESIPVPATVDYTVCCETVLVGGEAVCTDQRVFTLPVTQSGPCTPYCSSSMTWKESAVTSIDEANAVISANIRFFQSAKAVPNPSIGFFDLTILLPGNQALSVDLIDLKGRLVKHYTIAYDTAKQQYPVDAHELQAGIYLCRISSAEFGDKVIRIVKE